METGTAVTALAALAHAGRLAVFRELVKAGPEGIAAGEVGRRVGVQPSTLSASLNVLANARLVTSRRAGRSIIYAAAYDHMGDLLSYLMEDCCNGRPEICAPLAETARACCEPAA